MALHYNIIKAKFRFCQVLWSSRNWKDNCIDVLSINDGFVATKTVVQWNFSAKSCQVNACLWVKNDPNSQVAISNLVMSLYGGST